MGEGGIVTTNNKDLYDKGCLLRSHGDDARYHHVIFGLNYRTTDIASAIGLNQVAKLDEFLLKRRYIGMKLRDALNSVDGVTPQKIEPGANHSYSYFSVRVEVEELKCSRDEFMNALMAENIDCAVHYPTALTMQPVIKETYDPASCPVSENLADRILSIPLHPFINEKEINYIVEGVEKVVDYYHR